LFLIDFDGCFGSNSCLLEVTCGDRKSFRESQQQLLHITDKSLINREQ